MFHGRASAKRRAQRRELERKGEEVPEELKPRVHSLNKALKRQMYELHRKAREMAQEKDPAKSDEWEKQQADWLAIVAREDVERRARGFLPRGAQERARLPVPVMAMAGRGRRVWGQG